MRKPRYSIIIPTLNEEKFLPHLLDSLVGQTKKCFEVIVVDGQSKDATVRIAKFYKKLLPISVFVTESAGVSRQRNLGAQRAQAHWLVFVDADSILLPQFIDRIDAYINFKHPKFFTTWLKSDGEKTDDAIMGLLMNLSIEGSVLIDRPWAPGPLTIVQKDVFESIGGYDEQATYGEDHDLAMMITETGVPFDMFREILYIYSFRRFRKEGNLTVVSRNLKSAFQVILTRRGPKHVKGFKGGGEIFSHTHQKSTSRLSLKKIQADVQKFIQDLLNI